MSNVHEITEAADEDAELRPRETKRGGLFVTDAELIERMGVPYYVARPVLLALDADPRSGFPKKQKLWGNRRYWPAVKDFLDCSCGSTLSVPQRRNANDR